jgi:putative transposase
MPRRIIQFVQGNYYHIYNRGAGRQALFLGDGDYVRCLQRLKAVAKECNIAIIAYCLLPNHYHWLARQDGEIPVGDLPKRVFGSYSQWFNIVHNRQGTLFEARFKVRLVATDEYVRHLCRYIHINPVVAGLASAPELWPYSNYQEWVGLHNGVLLDRSFIERFFGSSERYTIFVREFLTDQAKVPPTLKAYFATLWD